MQVTRYAPHFDKVASVKPKKNKHTNFVLPMDIDDIDDPFAHGACVRPSLADSGAGVNLEGESDENRGQVDPDELGDNQSASSGAVADLRGGDGAPHWAYDAVNAARVARLQAGLQ